MMGDWLENCVECDLCGELLSVRCTTLNASAQDHWSFVRVKRRKGRGYCCFLWLLPFPVVLGERGVKYIAGVPLRSR